MFFSHENASQIALYTCCSCQSSYRSVIGAAQTVCRRCSHECCSKCTIWGSGEEDDDSLHGAEQAEASTSYTTESRRPTNAELAQRRSTTSNTPQSPFLDDFGFRTVTGPSGTSYTSSPSRSRSRDDLFHMDKRTASGRIPKAAGPPSSLLRRGSSIRHPQMENLQTPPGSGSRAYFTEGGMCGTPSQMGTPLSASGDSFSSTPYQSASPWDDSVYGTPQFPEFENFDLEDSTSAAIDADRSAGPPATKRKLRDHPECPVRLEEVLRKKPKKRRMTKPQEKVWVTDPDDQKLMDRKRNTMHARNSRLNRTTYIEGLETYQEWATPKIEKLEQQLEAQKEIVARLQRENAALKPDMAPPPVPTDIAQNFGTPEPSFEGDWPVMNNSAILRPRHAGQPDRMSFFPSLQDDGVSVQPNAQSLVSHPPLATPHPTISGTPIPDPDTAAQHEQGLIRALAEGGVVVSQPNAGSTTPTEPPNNIQWSYSRQPAPGPSSARIPLHDQDVFFADSDLSDLANLDPSLWSS